MKNEKFLKFVLTLVILTAQSTALASSPPVTLEEQIEAYIESVSPNNRAAIKDVIVLGTKVKEESGKEFKTVRFIRESEGVKSIITMEVEFGKNGVGPESDVLSVVNLTPVADTKPDLVNQYDSGPATNLFSPRPKKKAG